jgi:hypothetical protein
MTLAVRIQADILAVRGAGGGQQPDRHRHPAQGVPRSARCRRVGRRTEGWVVAGDQRQCSCMNWLDRAIGYVAQEIGF